MNAGLQVLTRTLLCVHKPKWKPNTDSYVYNKCVVYQWLIYLLVKSKQFMTYILLPLYVNMAYVLNMMVCAWVRVSVCIILYKCVYYTENVVVVEAAKEIHLMTNLIRPE